jgi:hypothetical protein
MAGRSTSLDERLVGTTRLRLSQERRVSRRSRPIRTLPSVNRTSGVPIREQTSSRGRPVHWFSDNIHVPPSGPVAGPSVIVCGRMPPSLAEPQGRAPCWTRFAISTVHQPRTEGCGFGHGECWRRVTRYLLADSRANRETRPGLSPRSPSRVQGSNCLERPFRPPLRCAILAVDMTAFRQMPLPSTGIPRAPRTRMASMWLLLQRRAGEI